MNAQTHYFQSKGNSNNKRTYEEFVSYVIIANIISSFFCTTRWNEFFKIEMGRAIEPKEHRKVFGVLCGENAAFIRKILWMRWTEIPLPISYEILLCCAISLLHYYFINFYFHSENGSKSVTLTCCQLSWNDGSFIHFVKCDLNKFKNIAEL